MQERVVVEDDAAGHLRDPETDDRHDDETADLLRDANVVHARGDQDAEVHREHREERDHHDDREDPPGRGHGAHCSLTADRGDR